MANVVSKEKQIYELIWKPTGRTLTLVRAASPEEAIKLAPPPWRNYLDDISARIDNDQNCN